MDRTAYVGAAPVTWDDYVAAIRNQGANRLRVSQRMMRKALDHLVLDERIFDKIGPAVNSGKSIFLYGPPGNGKTTIAESVGRLILGCDMYIPYAVRSTARSSRCSTKSTMWPRRTRSEHRRRVCRVSGRMPAGYGSSAPSLWSAAN